MYYCRNCGSKIRKGFKFCIGCGKLIESDMKSTIELDEDPKVFAEKIDILNLKPKDFIKVLSVLKILVKKEPNNIKILWKLAIIQKRRCKYKKAIKNLQKVLELDPNRVGALINLGSSYYEIEEYDKAMEIFNNITKSYPDIKEITLSLAKVCNKQNDYEKAIDYLEKYILDFPYDSTAWFELGLSYKTKDNPALFMKYFSKAINIESDNGKVVELSKLESKRIRSKWINKKLERTLTAPYEDIKINPLKWNNWQKLIDLYQTSDHLDKAIRISQYALTMYPDKSYIYLILGKVYVKLNNFKRSIMIAKEGIKINPKNISLMINLAYAYFKNKEYRNAKLTLESAFNLDSENVNTLSLYGQILHEEGKFKDSSNYFIKALNNVNKTIQSILLELPKIKFPIKDNAYERKFYLAFSEELDKKYDRLSEKIQDKIYISFELGLNFLNLGEFDKAEELAKNSLYVKKNAEAYFLLSLFHFCLDNYQECIENCIKALKVGENQKSIRMWLIRYYFEAGNKHKAVEIANSIIENEPEDELVWNMLGYIYSKSREYQKATEALNKAILFNYKFADPWCHLGYIEYKNGNMEEAISDLKKALKIDLRSYRAYYYFAEIKFSRGKYDEALIDCNKCIEIDPKFKDAYALRNKIKNLH